MNEIELQQKLDNAIETFRTEMNEIQKELLKWKESKKESKWKPKDGERYYFRDVGGATSSYNWTNSDIDKRIFEHTLTFSSYEECEKYWEFRDAVKEKSYEFSEEEWEDSDKPKYYIDYTYSLKKFDVLKSYCCKQTGSIYFKTAKNAQHIIDNYKEQLLKYWI